MDIERFFQGLADAVIEGDFVAAAARYTYPLVIYEPRGIEIHKSVEDSSRRLAERLISMRAGGAKSVSITVDNVGPKLNNRQPFDVTKTYRDVAGRALGISRLRYFCRVNDGQIRVELIEITEAFCLRHASTASAVCH